MNLTEKKVSNTVSSRIQKNKIYINTLIPGFQFKNKLGRIIKPLNRCITL